MKLRAKLLLAAGLLAIPVAAYSVRSPRVQASDHADTAENYNRSGADLADVFIFPSPTNPLNVVLAMDVHPLIPAGQGDKVSFDPGVLYQFKMDLSGDYVEDLVIQARFSGVGPSQRVVISGPTRPYITGTTSVFANPSPTTGLINRPFSIPLPNKGGVMQVFAGARSDPFFFDLDRFFQILPDRATPGTGHQVDFPSIMAADTPQVNGFRGFAPNNMGYDTSPAMDILATLNVLSIVVELPRSALGGGMIRLWETTSVPTGAPAFNFIQQDRLARPAVNEALATVTARRHEANNKVSPTQDGSQIKTDILTFMNFPAGRSPAIANALASVLTPDVMVADLSKPGKASYLGVETGGFTGGTFGGRDLRDDVIDIDLGAIFGNVIPALGLAPDDHKELPQFATDNVGPHTDYMNTFPYLGNPH